MPASSAIDLEKATVAEHAVIRVLGMTCTGCERKLANVLSGTAGVHNVKVSLVLGRAEFDVDGRLSVDEVATVLERQTEFKCSVIQKGHQLEVLIPEVKSALASRIHTNPMIRNHDTTILPCGLAGPSYPPGVEGVQIIDSKGRVLKSSTVNSGYQQRSAWAPFTPSNHRHIARISYDPCIIGARDLLGKAFEAPLSLAPLSSVQATVTETDRLRQSLFMTLLSAVLTIPVLIMAWASLPPPQIPYEAASLVLATMVQVVVAGPFYPKALKALLFSGMIEMDLLIVISTTTAYVYSVVAFGYEIRGKPLSTGSFFETSTLLVTLIMCGRLASAYARRKAAASISVQALQPSTACLYEDGEDRQIDVREFQYDDLFKILPDSIVPTDGLVVSGETEMDESMITGEAVPVPKFSGSQFVAGSVNGSGSILARLTKLPVDNTISRIASMVDEANVSKPKVQETADRVASYFVPCILALTVVVFTIWVAVGMTVRHMGTSDALVNAVTFALAALIVSCPCAIGLAVPMVMVIAGGVSAKHGIIIKSPDAIENARKVSHVVFDKTGTLTEGKFVVAEEIYRGDMPKQAASITRQLTSGSKQPVSLALTLHLASIGTEQIDLETVSSVVGKGMHAIWRGESVKGGSPFYVDAAEDSDVQRLLSAGLTVFCLRHGSALLAVYGLRDALRPDAKSVISSLQARNIPISIVSGDSPTVVNNLANELGIPLSHSKGNCTPEEKARYVSRISTTTTTPPGPGKTLTSSPRPAYAGGMRVFTNAPAANKMAKRL